MYASTISANDAFKLKYPRYIKAAILIALALTILFIWLWPGYEAEPYQIRVKEEIIIMNLPDPVVIPDPPAPLAPPRIPPNIEVAPIEDSGFAELEWEPPDFWERSYPQPIDPSIYEGFVASSSLPLLKYQAKASYPEIARRMRLEGTVMVHVLVDASGKVDQAVVIQSVHPALDNAAMVAARKCRFSPARQREMKVKAWVAIPFRFKLN